MTVAFVTGTTAANETGTSLAPNRGDQRIVTCVEIGFGWDTTAPGQGAGKWVDVTSYVRTLSTSRGRNQELQQFEAGTLSATLSNADGRFSPWNTAGAYYPGVDVGIPIRVRLSAEKSAPNGSSPALSNFDPTDGGFLYGFYGYLTDIEPTWDEGGKDAIVTIQATDGFGVMNRTNLVNAVFPTGGSTTGVTDPPEVPERTFVAEVAVRVAATHLMPATNFTGQVEITNLGPNPIYIGEDDSITVGDGTEVLSTQSVFLDLPTSTGFWAITSSADQVSPADTYLFASAGLQYAHDRLVQGLDPSLVPGAYVHFDEVGPSNFGAGNFTVPYGPVVDSGPYYPITDNFLSHMQGIADSAFIDLYVRPDGVVCWRSYTEVRDQTFDGTTIFGDNAGEIPYVMPAHIYDDENLYNSAAITPASSSDAFLIDQATDATSIAKYGTRVFEETYDVWPYEVGLGPAPTTFVPSAIAAASTFILRYKTPVIRIPTLQLSLRALTDAQRDRVLSLPIGYRVQVKRRPPTGDALTAECHFEGIQLDWAEGMKDVQATLNLAPSRAPGTYPPPP